MPSYTHAWNSATVQRKTYDSQICEILGYFSWASPGRLSWKSKKNHIFKYTHIHTCLYVHVIHRCAKKCDVIHGSADFCEMWLYNRVCVCMYVKKNAFVSVGVHRQIYENLRHFAWACQNRLPECISYTHTHTLTHTHTHTHTLTHTHTHLRVWWHNTQICENLWHFARACESRLTERPEGSPVRLFCGNCDVPLFCGNLVSFLQIKHVYSTYVAAPFLHMLLSCLFCANGMPLLQRWYTSLAEMICLFYT